MKSVVSWFVIICMLTLYMPSQGNMSRTAAAGGFELFSNGGFEETGSASGWEGNVSATSWGRYTFSGSPIFAVDPSVSHEGDHSLRMEALTTSRSSIFQQTSAVTVNSTYKISGWMKTELSLGKGLIRLQVGRTSGGHLLINIAEGSGDQDWFYFEKTVKIPTNATSPAWLKVEALLENGVGKVWFDDISVTEWVAVQGVELAPKSVSLSVNDSVQLNAQLQPANATNQATAWSTSNAAVATVDHTGLVTTHSNGYAVIQAETLEGGFTDTAYVSAGAPATLTLIPYEGTTQEDTALTGQLAATDSTGEHVTFEKVSEPDHGKVMLDEDGGFLYYPDSDYSGEDIFIYMARTSQGGPAFGAAVIDVLPVNDAPVLDLQWASTVKDTPLSGQLKKVSDKEGHTIQWSKMSEPLHGTLQVQSSGAYTYTPDTGFVGYDEFQIGVLDSEGGTSAASMKVYISPSAADILTQFGTQSTYEQHPRLLADDAQFQLIRSLIGHDHYVTEWYDLLQPLADAVIDTTPLPYASNGSNNAIIRNRLLYTALMYQLTEDSQYADRTIQELEAMADYADWGGRYNNMLALSELTFTVSLAYDWVYDAMTPAQRLLITDAIREKSLLVALDWYNGVFTHNGESNNINLVDNGAFGLAALAIADEGIANETAAGAVLVGMYNKLQQALRFYTDDGAWPEGPAYWHYGGQYLTYVTAALNHVLGTDYGLSSLDGFMQSGDFPLHMLGEGGFFNFNDGSISSGQPESMWFADFYNKPELSWHLGDLYDRKGVYSPLYLVLYKPGLLDVAPTELDRFYSGIESASMRSGWDDPNALYASMKGTSETLRSHFDADAGTFVFDALGWRWATDLGNESYELPGFWDYANQRWTYYRKKTEGHNTIVINPADNPVIQQDPAGKALRVREESKPRGAYTILDMTDVYKQDAVSMTRGMMLTADRTQLIVQDEMKLKTSSELYWFMHTAADITIVENGKAAILQQGDKRLYVKMLEGPADAVFSVMNAEPLPTSPDPAGQSTNFGIRKLAVHLNGVVETNLSVWLVPLYDTDPIPTAAPAYTPLDNWSIPEGELQPLPERPTAQAITVDGIPLQGFNPKGTYYEMLVPFDTETMPVVAAASNHELSIEQATAVPGKAVIRVTDVSQPMLQNTYTVTFKRLPLIGEPEGLPRYEVAEVTASAVPEAAQGNTPEKTIDGNLDTRWSAPGKQWIQYDLGGVEQIAALSAAFYNGAARQSYFDWEISLDGMSWTKLLTVVSSGTTALPETQLVPTTEARYVRLVGYGNSSNNYNSLTEVALYGPSPAIEGQEPTEVETGAGANHQNTTPERDNLRSLVLEAIESSPPAAIAVDAYEMDGVYQVNLPADLLMEAADKAPILELVVRSPFASYKLPVHLLDWEALAKQLGAAPDEVMIAVTIEKSSERLTNELKDKLEERQASLLSEGIEFRVTAESRGQLTDLNDFQSYVTRTILLPDEVEPSKVSGIMYDPGTGKIIYAPATFETTEQGITAVIKRTGNSLYAVAEANRSFVDVEGHWAQGDIELLANKWLIEGTGEGHFDPEGVLSRAEFAVMLARAMGLEEQQPSATFHDVPASAWYSGYAEAAASAGLITGYEDGSFRAAEWITREQIAVMLVHAMERAGKSIDATETMERLPSTFVDYHEISSWAKQAVAIAHQSNIIQGTPAGNMEPQAAATRAQAVVMLKRFLQFVAFMNE
ncbi:S-layer homology domain-containing protein [Paenibacillus sp. strain BS8-2]